MMRIAASSVADYLSRLPTDHRVALTRVRDVVRRNLPPGFEEGLLFDMISWFIPPERYGHTYNGQPLIIAALASQKNYMALYLTGVYSDPAVSAWFANAFAATGKKLDMGKSCVRFRSLEDLPLDVIASAVSRVPVAAFITSYERVQAGRKQNPIVMPGRLTAAPNAFALAGLEPASGKAGSRKPAARTKAPSKPATAAAPAAKAPRPASASKPPGTSPPATKRKAAASKPPRTA